MRRYLIPALAGVVVWLAGSWSSAYRIGSRFRLTGPGHDAISPIIDAWTQTALGWLAPGFFVFVAVFVFERWLEDRRAHRIAKPPAAN
jgi:hypothetical protein